MPAEPVAPTRVRDLLLIAVPATGLGWLAVRQFYGDLPRLQWFVPLSLALLAAAETMAGTQLRARIRRRPGTVPVQPLVAARALALAKASSQVGAAMLGLWVGLLWYTAPRRDYLAAAGDDARTAGLGALSALLLVGGGLWLEYCCRAPKPPPGAGTDERDPPHGTDYGPNGVGPLR